MVNWGHSTEPELKMIYLDNNATTPLAPGVAAAMNEALERVFGNPSSSHAAGAEAKQLVDVSREQVAAFLGASGLDEIVFTSGGTESDNAAILGALETNRSKRHIVTTTVEHEAVRKLCEILELNGYDVTWLGVDEAGRIDLEQLRGSLREDTAVVSVMLANNETGVIFPVEEVAGIVKEHCKAYVHVDGVNAAGKIPIDLNESNIDLFSISAHKFHGPKGIGALYVKRGVVFQPMLIGGGQETGRRGGTEAVHQIVAMGAAAAFSSDLSPMANVRDLRDLLENNILASVSETYVNGDRDRRLPNTSNISVDGLNGEMLLHLLDQAGICVSTGSACHSGSHTSSPVLQAMNVPYSRALGSVRFSLSRFNRKDEIDNVISSVKRSTGVLRQRMG